VRRWLRTASIGWIIPIRIAVGLLSILALSAVRLLSERPIGRSGKERPMKITRSSKKNADYLTIPKRRYWQYCLETIWAGMSGAAVGCWQP
jgi:hypothetical protein